MAEDKITPLHVVAPKTAEQACRDDAIALLREALAEAEAGNVTECVIILRLPGHNKWRNLASSTLHISEWLGKLAMVQFTWMHQYLIEQGTDYE